MSNDTILQNLEYVVLKDQPTNNSYGQYIFDLYNIGNQFPGQSDGDSDYFTNQDNIHNPNSYKLRTEIGHDVHSRNIYLSNIMFYMDSHKYSNFGIHLRYFDSECDYVNDWLNMSDSEAHDNYNTLISNCENGIRDTLYYNGNDSNEDRSGIFLLTDISDSPSEDYYSYSEDNILMSYYNNYSFLVDSHRYISDLNVDYCASGLCKRIHPQHDNPGSNQTESFSYNGIDFNGVMPMSIDEPSYGGYTPVNIFDEVYSTNLPSQSISGSFYVCTYGSGDNWSLGYGGWETRTRGRRIECFDIPKKDFVDQWFNVIDYTFERGGSTSSSSDETYNVKHYNRFKNFHKSGEWENDVKLFNTTLAVGILPPQYSEIEPFSKDVNFDDDFMGWINPESPHDTTSGFRFYNPYKNESETYNYLDLTGVYKPDGTPLTLSEAIDLDFRMLVKTNVNELEVQRTYEVGSTESSLVSVPANLSLSVDVGSNDNSYYLNSNFDVGGKSYTLGELKETFNINVKYFVADWGDGNYDNNQDNIYFEFPTNISEYNNAINRNVFNVVEHTSELNHVYFKSGDHVITIFAVMVFEREHSDGTVEDMVLKTKKIETKIRLETAEIFYSDYMNLGRGDFPLIPWFDTAPVIGGVSEESDYYDSLRVLSNSADSLFDEFDERFIKGYTRTAFTNDELGEHLGKTDIGQIRYFSEPYDMSRLLNTYVNNKPNLEAFPTSSPQYFIDNVNEFPEYFEQFDITGDNDIAILDNIAWTDAGRADIAEYIRDFIIVPNDIPSTFPYISYSNIQYWDGELNKFPMESSVGKIFINDMEDPDLKKNCLIEYNFYDNDGIVVRDSSGNENNGVLIGDFGLFKLDKDIPIGVDSTIKKPKIDESNDGVF